MNFSAKASHHATAIRNQLKPFIHGGGTFSGEEVAALLIQLNTVIELAKGEEEENRFLSRELTRISPRPQLVVVGGNIVPFRRPGAPKPTWNGGGDAA